MRRALITLGMLIIGAGSVACGRDVPDEVHSQVSLRAFGTDRKPLERARVTFRDADGDVVGTGTLVHERGFRFESEQLGEDSDWGRRVQTVDIETDQCSSRGDRVALEEESLRVAVGGHPSLSSKKVTRYKLRASLVCFPALSDEQRRATERDLRQGDVRARLEAASLLGWVRAPEDASAELQEAMQDSTAIALGLVHNPHPSALPALTRALQDDRERVRVAAAVLLAKLGRNEGGVAVAALPDLERLRSDPSELVQLLAGHAIDKITPR
jgi:hypothetical protein